MDEKIILDPRRITGDIDLNTPLFIVEYFAKFCKRTFNTVYIYMDSYRDELIKHINEHDYPKIDKVDENLTDVDLRKIIKFISPTSSSSEWFVDSILEGYNHLIMFDVSYNELPYISKTSLSFGMKTNDNPLSLNELIVYRIAKYYSYPINKETTLNELNVFVERILSKKVSSLKTSLLHTINSMTDVELLKIYHIISSGFTIDNNEEEFSIPESRESKFLIDQNYLDMSLTELFNKKKMITRIKPKTNYEAIIYAAVKHKINITSSSSPLKEIDNLKRTRYIPYCNTFARKYSTNSKFYNINKKWCENLSNQEIYTIEQMKFFALDEGYEKVNSLSFNEINSYLKSTRSIMNFYFGRHPECKEINTIITLTPINEIPDDELICFGIERTGDLLYTCIDEIVDFFKNMKFYVYPSKLGPIDERVINKLRLFCSNATGKLVNKTKKLIEIMTELDKIKKLLDCKVKDLKIKISKLDNETKENVDYFFRKCMEMGLYMRGWKIEPDKNFPLLSQDTIINEKFETKPNYNIDPNIYGEGFVYTNKQKIMDNTVIAYEESMEILKELPIDISNDIKLLQTLRFTENGQTEEIMGYLFRGAYVYQDETLIDSMKSIYKGINNSDSCMRTNSNWILYSSVWYRLIFDFEVPFRIDKIQSIR